MITYTIAIECDRCDAVESMDFDGHPDDAKAEIKRHALRMGWLVDVDADPDFGPHLCAKCAAKAERA